MEQQTLYKSSFPELERREGFAVREVSPQYWSDLEVLTAIVGVPAISLLKLIGDLHELHGFEKEQLCRVSGIGPSMALRLKAALELGRRVAQGKSPVGVKIGSPDDLVIYLKEELRYYKKEHFKAILLNTKNRVISVENISIGILNASLVHPREVFNPAIKKSAAAIILAHNHPSEVAVPSKEDVEVTQRLVEAGEIMGVKVLDHIIIGGDDYYSFKERELI